MAILIDGYNLLHAAGIIPRGIGAGTLERARSALLNWLVATLPPDQLNETTVVFDAADPPPGLPRRFEHKGVTVLYSTDYENADAMIEHLIRQDAVPKRLQVVSSDHRVQRAAKRRKSKAIDSDVWYFDVRHQAHAEAIQIHEESKPTAPLSTNEVEHWLNEFGEMPEDIEQLEATSRPPSPRMPSDDPPDRAAEGSLVEDPASADEADLANPFPPGYGEDLLKPGANLEE